MKDMKMKNLILLMALAFSTVVACNASSAESKVAASASAPASSNLPLNLGFLEKIGVDVSKILELSNNDREFFDGTLEKEQVLTLLPMLSRMSTDELDRDYNIRGAKALSHGLTMLLYSVETGDDSTTELLAIYDKDGVLTDYMQLEDWDGFAVLQCDASFDKGLAEVTDTKLTFASPSEFVLDETVKEGSWHREGDDGSISSDLTDLRCLVQTLRRYSIDDKGHMALVEEKVVKREGKFAPESERNPIYYFYRLPASDHSRIDRLNEMVNERIAQASSEEEFEEENGFVIQMVVGEVFAASPDALLNWFYKNRKTKSALVGYFKSIFADGWVEKSVLDQEIDKLPDAAAKKYLKNLTASWTPGQ